MTGEVALALVLLSGAGPADAQLLPSAERGSRLRFARRADLPYQPAACRNIRRTSSKLAFFDRALDGIRALPGVTSAGAASIFPLAGSDTISPSISGQAPKPPGKEPSAMYYAVTPGYFETMRIPLEGGTPVHSMPMRRTRARAPSSARRWRGSFIPTRIPSGSASAMGGPATRRPRSSALWATCAMRIWSPRGRAAVYQTGIADDVNNSMFFAVRTAGDPGIADFRRARGVPQSRFRIAARCRGNGRQRWSKLRSRSAASRMLLMAIFAGAGDGAGHGRDLRRALVFGDPGDAGDRYPSGSGRATRRCAAAGFALTAGR